MSTHSGVSRCRKTDPYPICVKIAELRLCQLRAPDDSREHFTLNAQITRTEASHPRCRYCTIMVGATHLERKLVGTELGPMCEHCEDELKRQGKQSFMLQSERKE